MPRCRGWMVLLLPLLAQRAPARDADPVVIDSLEVRRVKAVLQYSARYPQLQADDWTVFTPVPPELPSQSKLKSAVTPDAKLHKEKAAPGRAYYQANIPAPKGEQRKEMSVTLTVEATLHSRQLRALKPDEKAPRVPDLSAADRKLYTAELGGIDHSKSGFQKWLRQEKLLREAREPEVDFARRVFLALKERGKYTYSPEMNRDASSVCQTLETDCGGWSMLFCAALRANQVPARSLFGRWAQSAKPDATLNGTPYYQVHVKAEFFAPGVGWVPVDLSGAIEHDRDPFGLTYFGRDKGDFIALHVDPQFEVDTRIFGVKNIFCLQNPSWWVTGSGDLKNPKFSESWVVSGVK